MWQQQRVREEATRVSGVLAQEIEAAEEVLSLLALLVQKYKY